MVQYGLPYVKQEVMVDFVGNCENRPPNCQIFWLFIQLRYMYVQPCLYMQLITIKFYLIMTLGVEVLKLR